MIKESRMSNAITPSLTRKLFNMAQEIGKDVIDLTLGDPDVATPEPIKSAACDAIMAGKTRYSANAGLLDVRAAYGIFFERHYGFSIDASKNIIATVGGMEGLFLSLAAIVDVGDEVIILAPYYVNYFQMINMFGGKAVVIDRIGKTTEELLCDIQHHVTNRTVAMIINSPCNPVGDVLSDDLIDGIARIAKRSDIIVISDEVYSSLIFDGKKHSSILTRSDMEDKTILIDSCSKRFAMTGWRIGFAVGPEQIISRMTKMQENVAACAALPSQYAAIRAYSEDYDYSYIRNEYERRRNVLYNGLCSIQGIKPIKPEATFYCFTDISETGLGCEEFSYLLLKEGHVAVVPGIAYGNQYCNYIRIAFTQKEEQLILALQRIKEMCNKFL